MEKLTLAFTVQAVEIMSFYRAMPNLLHIRPADAEEVVVSKAVYL